MKAKESKRKRGRGTQLTGRTDIVHTIKVSQIHERKLQAMMDMRGLDNFSEFVRALIDEEAERILVVDVAKHGREARRILAALKWAG
jgi:hypothetical protein